MSGATGLSIVGHGPSTFSLMGEIDLASAPDLDAMLIQATTMDGPLVLDVTAVGFMDSSGVRSVLGALKSKPSGCIVLHGVREGPAKVLRLTGLDQVPALHLIPCDVEGVAS